jgi:hypothetical protein
MGPPFLALLDLAEVINGWENTNQGEDGKYPLVI